MKEIVRGNEAEANTSSMMRGWVVGHMHHGIASTPKFEIKLWRYNGPIDYGRKKFAGTEFVVIYGGRLRFETEDESGRKESFVLDGEKREYIIFPPGLTKTVVVEIAPAFGTTVRWPSHPGVNEILL